MISEYEDYGGQALQSHIFVMAKYFGSSRDLWTLFYQSPRLHNPIRRNLRAARRLSPTPIYPSSGSWDFNIEPIRQAQGRL